MTALPVAPGQILCGKYRIERVLGRGGNGVVVAATHLGLRVQVALKLLHGDGATPDQEARFEREARIGAMLKSEHVGQVHDIGRLETGQLFIEMDLLEGKDLAALVRERGPLPVGEAVSYVLEACHGVALAHARGVIHRDIKPANLFLAETSVGRHVKVLDFGVGKLQGEEDARLTKTGQTVGSPLYMAPELMLAAKDADARADVWAFGIVLYELLAGATPFAAMTLMEVVARVLRDAPTPLTHHRPDLPGLWAIVAQCLEKDRERRFQTITDFVSALAPFAPPDMADYVTRIAKQQGMEAAPDRPTSPMNLVPAELAAPFAAPAATVAPSSAVVPPAPLAPTGKPPAVRAAMILAAAAVLCGVAALFLRLRAPPIPHEEQHTATTASAQTTPAPQVPTVASPPIAAPLPVPTPVASPATTGPAEAPATTPAPLKVKATPRNLPPAVPTARPAKNVYDP